MVGPEARIEKIWGKDVLVTITYAILIFCDPLIAVYWTNLNQPIPNPLFIYLCVRYFLFYFL